MPKSWFQVGHENPDPYLELPSILKRVVSVFVDNFKSAIKSKEKTNNTLNRIILNTIYLYDINII